MIRQATCARWSGVRDRQRWMLACHVVTRRVDSMQRHTTSFGQDRKEVGCRLLSVERQCALLGFSTCREERGSHGDAATRRDLETVRQAWERIVDQSRGWQTAVPRPTGGGILSTGFPPVPKGLRIPTQGSALGGGMVDVGAFCRNAAKVHR